MGILRVVIQAIPNLLRFKVSPCAWGILYFVFIHDTMQHIHMHDIHSWVMILDMKFRICIQSMDLHIIHSYEMMLALNYS